MPRQDRKDDRFHAVRAYSEARDVACAQVQIPYRKRGRSWDVEDGQSQFAGCSAETAAPSVAPGARLALRPAGAGGIAHACSEGGFFSPDVARAERARAAEVAASRRTRDSRLAERARDCRVR